jgi:phosphatidylglycerophosphate synthase
MQVAEKLATALDETGFATFCAVFHVHNYTRNREAAYNRGMKLHQSSNVPDWQLVAPAKRTQWQQLAAATHGVLTPGNLVSLLGVVLVFAGLVLVVSHDYLPGLTAVLLGRLCDMLDGIVADRTGTKSPFGEGVDASLDKLGALATLIVLAAEDIVPWPVALIVGAQNVANSVIALIAKLRHVHLHPLTEGKLGTAGQWIGLAGFMAIAGIGPRSDWMWLALSYGVLGASLVVGAYATVRYGVMVKSGVPLGVKASRRTKK